MDDQKVRTLLNKIEDKGFIGAGPEKLSDNPDWRELRSLFAIAKMPAPQPAQKPVNKKAVKK